MEGNKKKKLSKKKERCKSKNQSISEYVPGSIANFLGSNQETKIPSESKRNKLASFFQPSSTIKQSMSMAHKNFSTQSGKGTTEDESLKKDESEDSREKTLKEVQTKIPPQKYIPNRGISDVNVTKAPKRKTTNDEEGESPTIKKKKQEIEPMDPVVLARTVFVGNLPVTITKKDLKGLFRIYGTIESMRFRSMGVADPSMPKKVAAIKQELNPKKTSFNAYIVFEEEQCAKAALASNGKLVNKHHMRVDIASNDKKHDMKRSVFVGNLPFNVEDEAVRAHFEEFGAVEGVRLIRDKATGVGKGFGYVLFEDSASVSYALKADGSKLNGRLLRIKRAVKKEKHKEERDHSRTRGKAVPRKSNSKSRAPPGFQGQKGKPKSNSKSFQSRLKKPGFKNRSMGKQKPRGNKKGKQKR